MNAGGELSHWIARIAIAVGLLVAGRQLVQAQGSLDPTGLLFTLADVRYLIALPRGATVRLLSGPTAVVEIWDEHTTARMRMFRLSLGDESDENYALSKTLSNSAVLKYSLDRDIGAGMRGTEGELKGRLQIGTHTIAVTCRDQREGFVEPEWCLRYLEKLKINDDR